MVSTATPTAPVDPAIAAPAAPSWRAAMQQRPRAGDAAATTRTPAREDATPQTLRLLSLVVWGVATVWATHESLLRAYGDAIAHELIARRVLDSMQPGIGQLGTVWLPLPSLLLTPLVWIDPLWRSGLAGAILGGALLQLSVGALYRAGFLLGGTAAGWVAAVVFLANPNTVYLYTTPLLEVAALTFTCLCIAAAAQVLVGLGRGELPPEALFAASIYAACGMLCRYDNWMTGVLVGGAILVATLWRLRDWQAVQAAAICFALVPCVAAALWFLYNYVIFKDPLAFLTGEYSSARLVADLAKNGAIPAINGHPPEQGDLALSLRTYLTASVEVLGAAPLLLAVAGSVVAVVRLRRKPIILLFGVLLAPVLFYVFALVRGESVIVTRAAQQDGLFNVRYGVALAPFVALGIAALVWIPRRALRIGAVAALVALTAASGVALLFEPRGPAIVAEGRLQDRAPNAQASHAAARWFVAQPHTGKTLMDDALQPQSKIIYAEGGRDLRDYIDSSTPLQWEESLVAPPPEIDTIITLGPASREIRNDRVARALVRDGAIPGFVRAFDNGEIVIYQRIPGGAA